MSGSEHESLQRVAAQLTANGTADLVLIGLAGSEPIWPVLAEGARFLQPFSASAVLKLFTMTETYGQLLELLRDSGGNERC